MTYQIVRITPSYCSITDALIGSKAHPLPMSYFSVELARKLAGRMHAADYENCGDSSFVVVRYGESAYKHPIHPSYQSDATTYEIPF